MSGVGQSTRLVRRTFTYDPSTVTVEWNGRVLAGSLDYTAEVDLDLMSPEVREQWIRSLGASR